MKKLVIMMVVVAIGALNASPAKALFRKKSKNRAKNHATYDTPRTMQLKARILATSDQTEQIEIKLDKLSTQRKANKSSIKSWEQEIKSIYKAQEDEAERIQAEKEQDNYQVGTLDFHYHESDTNARMTDDDDLRAEAMADYGGYNDDFKTIVPTENKFLVSKGEKKRRYVRQSKGGVNYYPATRN